MTDLILTVQETVSNAEAATAVILGSLDPFEATDDTTGEVQAKWRQIRLSALLAHASGSGGGGGGSLRLEQIGATWDAGTWANRYQTKATGITIDFADYPIIYLTLEDTPVEDRTSEAIVSEEWNSMTAATAGAGAPAPGSRLFHVGGGFSYSRTAANELLVTNWSDPFGD